MKHLSKWTGRADERGLHIRLGPNEAPVGDGAVAQKIVSGAVLKLSGHDDSIRKIKRLFNDKGGLVYHYFLEESSIHAGCGGL